jgi:hypothetical protein
MLSARQWCEELEQFRSGPNVGVPAFIRYALDGDRDATLSLCRRTRNLFTTVLKPYWPDIRANHHGELVRHRRLVADACYASEADRWQDRVDTVTGSSRDVHACALLSRPDCYVAWATDTARPDQALRESLRAALGTCFEAPCDHYPATRAL